MTKEEFSELKKLQDKIARNEHALILINSIIDSGRFSITVCGYVNLSHIKRDVVISDADDKGKRLLLDQKETIEKELLTLNKEFEKYTISK